MEHVWPRFDRWTDEPRSRLRWWTRDDDGCDEEEGADVEELGSLSNENTEPTSCG